MKKIAINGFGRIGRGFVRALRQSSGQAAQGLELVAINDLAPAENLAYLLKYDTVYGTAKFSVEAKKNALVVDGREIPVSAVREPADSPWRDMQIDIVVESTGLFTDAEKARGHITAGAKRVVITAPAKGDPSTSSGQAAVETILIGANEEKFGTCDITSNASCTTN